MIKKIYHSIQLNWGIKNFLERFWLELVNFCENKLVFPLYCQLDRYFYQRLVHHYGADYRWNDQKSQNLDKKTTNYGYGLFHYALVRNQRPKRVLCVGSMYGYIPYMLAKACQDNGFGQVDFVDAGYSLAKEADQDVHYFGQGFWQEGTIKDHFSYFLDPVYLNAYVMTTEEFAEKYPARQYDYIYLDGDHSYQGASLDMKLFWPKLNQEGFVCFHDIHLERSFLEEEAQEIDLEFGYKQLWQELIKEHQFKFELSNHYSGLGFIQKL